MGGPANNAGSSRTGLTANGEVGLSAGLPSASNHFGPDMNVKN